MAIPLDRLWQDTPKSAVSYRWAPLVAQQNSVENLTTVDAPLGPPLDELWWITRFHIRADPGAGQNFTIVQLSIQSPPPINIELAQLFRTDVAGAADVTANVQDSLDVVLLGGTYRLLATAVFNAAVAANRVVLSACGYRTPRANASL